MGCCFSNNRSGTEDERTSLLTSLIVSDQEPYQPIIRYTTIIEQPFDPCKSHIEWNHTSDVITVGITTVATIKFIRRDGSPYVLISRDSFRYNISHDDQSVPPINSIREPGRSLAGHNSVRISFTPRIIGNYTLTFKLNDQKIGGQSYIKIYTAGPPVLSRTVIHNQTNYIITKCGIYYCITISPRDEYGNIAIVNTDLLYLTVIKGGSSGIIMNPDCITEDHNDVSRLHILVKLDEPGYYIGTLKYEEAVIGLQDSIIICLTEDGVRKMEQNIQTNFLNIEHKAKVIPENKKDDRRKVKCYISPRLLQVREPSWLLFSSRLFTCRVCNSTRIEFHNNPGQFTIDDGLQTPITLVSESREIIAAIFYTFIQRNSGGAETFQEKQRHFYTELKAKNNIIDSSDRPTVEFVVKRFNLLESAMHATRGFKTDSWKSKFYVTFEGEDGIDLGGVTREFLTCLSDTMFSGRNPQGLFTRFTDIQQGLVHPTSNRKRDPLYGIEYYQFAGRIAGKCLFEAALDNPLFLKAHFTRSFLAQLIGLRVSWKHFETDDPEVYRYRVDQIRNSSLEELDLSLTFADEIFDDSRPSSDPLVISLHPGGSKQRVTNGNKMEYLTQLAQYRFVKSVSEEVRYFLKGLREFIPDELLAMFDENELELLMCGIQKISYQDLKQHTEIRGYTREFMQSVEWFWTVVSEFTPEELARLVQFVTGSSQIPPGGFSELTPPFLLASSGLEYNRLPYAHTCFNHLCLPNYDTFEQFRRSLMTAINEGSEGILLS